MARRKIETPTVPGSIVVDLKNGKTLEKALPAVICSRIKLFREKLGIEQKALAARIGVTFNARGFSHDAGADACGRVSQAQSRTPVRH